MENHMPQISSGYKTSSMHRIFENKISGHCNASKQLEVVSWFHTNDGSVYSPSIHQTQDSLAYQVQMSFSN